MSRQMNRPLVFLLMRKIITLLLAVLIILAGNVSAAKSVTINDMRNSITKQIADTPTLLNRQNEILRELDLLKDKYIDINKLSSIDVVDNELVYGLYYSSSDIYNYVKVSKTDTKTTFAVAENGKINVLIFTSQNEVYLDGHKVTYSANKVPETNEICIHTQSMHGRYTEFSRTPFKNTSYGTSYTQINQSQVNIGTPIANTAISILCALIGTGVEVATGIIGIGVVVGAWLDVAIKGLREYNVRYTPTNAYASFKIKKYRHPDSVGSVDVHNKYDCTFYNDKNYQNGIAGTLVYYEHSMFM